MAEDAKPGPDREAAASAGPPSPATIQARPGDPVAVLATVTGEPVPPSAPPALPPARYELGSEIARGGMGRVVEATDTRLGRRVALKEALALDADSLRRFARETRITARLEHPSIVPVHDAGTLAGGAPFYVMRKVGGRPLERLVAAAERLDQRLALLPHIVAAAHAIAHAHERGIVHRDIKPSNILCGELGETIVIDWGLAKVIGEPDDAPTAAAPSAAPDDVIETRAGIVYGTPGFMAPEQLRGITVDARCDVYALGATLYHLLSRRPPHHAKTAEEMMQAAVAAPPASIAVLVPGVPKEVATIVEKALAHDPRARYQDARALAEDLQRFLTGQLVASHHYTAGERLVRFAKRNRVAVGVAAAAVLALVIGGTLAIGRIVAERDRADEAAETALAAQRRAEEHNELLVLQQARSKVALNPTEAVAMIKPLAAGPRWREVRSIAQAARAHGVAWSLPAPRRTETLRLSRDGRRAVLAGDDGSLRIYDLERRQVTLLRERGPALRARFADRGRRVVAWSGREIEVLDPGTGNRLQRFETRAAIRDLEVVGDAAYLIDEPGRELWRLELDLDAVPVPVRASDGGPLLSERLDQLAPAPKGGWLALAGEDHLLVLDTEHPEAAPVEVLLGKTRDLAWSGDGSHLAVLVERGDPTDRQAVAIAFAGGAPQIVHRIRVGSRRAIAISARGAIPRMYTIGPMGVGVASRVEATARKQLVGEPIAVVEAGRGAVVAASQGGIAILTDDGDHSVPAPVGRLEVVAASAHAPYVVAAIAGRILVWDLAQMLPRRLAARVPVVARFAGDRRVFAAYLGAAEWIELATGRAEPAGQWPSVIDVVTRRDGEAACVLAAGADGVPRAELVVRGRPPEELGPADLAVFAGDRLALGTRIGTIRIAGADGGRALVASRGTAVVQLAASRDGGHLAAVFADGTLWRLALATGVQATTRAGAAPRQIAIAADGTVVFPEGRALRAWSPAGTVAPLAELPEPIDALGLAGPRRAVAVAAGGTGYVVELDAPGRHSDAFEVYADRAVMSPDAGLMVTSHRGSIEVIDPIVAHRWTLAGSPGLTFTSPQISNDGRHVIARRIVIDREKRDLEARVVNVLLAWRLVTPPDAATTARWLAGMTNAIVDPGTARLGWR